jgi:polyketide synthase 12/epothilone polyketide synthase D
VSVAQADVADRAQLAAALAAIPQEAPLRGVVHAAGVLDDGVLREQSEERFRRVLAPKIFGAWHLHELTRAMPLEVFCLVSSAASLLGPAGQGAYAAANAFLDGLARCRQEEGLPALSLSFGPWSMVGMAARLGAAEQARLVRQGVKLLSPAQGLAALAEALDNGAAHLAALGIESKALRAVAPNDAPALLRGLLAEPSAAAPAPASSDVLARLKEAKGERRAEILERELSVVAARILGLQKDQVPPDKPLRELGMDSLMAVELKNAISALTGQALSATVAFDHPSLRALAAHLIVRLGLAPAPASSTAPTAPGRSPQARADSDLAALSQKETLAELESELKELGELHLAPGMDG